jgi:L-asparagine transporter-like permease|tara:strand:- start:593 stop:886 length:294 start_codon:yes stop_codon:yes gene_type:complete
MVIANPEPTPETKTLADRFKMPNFPTVTIVQFVLIALIGLYGFSVRKMNRPVLLTMVAGVAVLHAYDHMYRVKRGPERDIFPSSKTEEYCCAGGCSK